MGQSLIISYSAALTRVRCEIVRQAARDRDQPPPELLEKAEKKLESVLESGAIAFYLLFPERLHDCWQALHASTPEAGEANLQLTLGAGAPELPGLVIERGTDDKVLLNITADATREAVQEWRWEWFKLWTLRSMSELGIAEEVNLAQLYGAFHKLRTDKTPTVQRVGPALKSAAPAGGGRAFSVVGNKLRREIGVVIRDVSELRKSENKDNLLHLVSQAVKQLSVDGVEYRILKKDFLAALQSGMDGPEGLGVGLPLTLLAAVGGPKQLPLTGYPGEGRISFVVAEDKMQAEITGFLDEYYTDEAAPVTIEWIQNELRRHGLVHPMAPDVASELQKAILNQEILDGLTACVGTPGKAARGPFLHFSYRDAENRAAGDLDVGQLDIRELQQRSTVASGQLVAELRYKAEPTLSRNVFNEEAPSPPPEPLEISLGEGIQARGNKYYATKDGIPVVGKAAIALTQTFIQDGDVNLRTGNIDYAGPIEISGSIDSGASVTSRSDILVYGSILGASVRAMGSLTAKSGIVTGPKGLIHVRGDLHADFIENSNIVCHGNLVVQKAILNSQLFVGGSIKLVTPGAVLAGGKVFSRGSLNTGNLGTQNGSMSFINVGVDWQTARSIEIKQRRIESLQKRAQEDRLVLRDLVQKKPGQMTQRHRDLKEELQEKLVRVRAICDKLEGLAAAKRTEMTYTSTAKILVRETLFTNVTMELCGQVIAIATDVAGVGVVPKRRRGSYFVPIEEIMAEAAQAEDDAPAPRAPRRAS